MKGFRRVPKSPFFNVMNGLSNENIGDKKVGMLREVDLSSAERLRKQVEEETEVRPSYTALVIKSISQVLEEQPHANRVPIGPFWWRQIIQLDHVDMSVAVERDEPGYEQATFAATIRRTDQLDLLQITQQLRELVTSAESNKRWQQFNWICRNLPSPLAVWILSVPRWFTKLWIAHRGGAALVSSPAKYGVDVMVASWPWPLGFSFGLVKARPVAVEGRIEARPTMTMTYSFDRRLMAGAPSARFFARVCDVLEQAEEHLWKRTAAVQEDDVADKAVTEYRANSDHS